MSEKKTPHETSFEAVRWEKLKTPDNIRNLPDGDTFPVKRGELVAHPFESGVLNTNSRKDVPPGTYQKHSDVHRIKYSDLKGTNRITSKPVTRFTRTVEKSRMGKKLIGQGFGLIDD